MAHGLNSMIKREIDCNNVSIKSPVAQTTLSPNSAAVNNSVSSTGSAQTCGNAKMGSRRIFTPQFKLQVLESYRNDSDCKGNQRATARKYGIHRRQIQKWLQCESNLRTSVANLNQSTIKHQFHNISHQMPVVSTGTHTNSSSSHSQHHQQQYKANNMLSLDTARHSVALTPITLPATTPTISVAAAAVSSVARAIAAAAATTTTTTTTKCVNGSNHNTTTIKSHTNTASVTLTTVQPPYRMNVMHVPDTAVLTHTPAVPNVVPLNPLHYHHHHHQQQQHQQQHQSRLLMPSASLPMPGSPVSATTNRTDELRDYQPIGVTGNCYMNEDHRNPPIYESLHYFNSHGGVMAPIDLSLGLNRRRDFNISENLCYITSTGASSWRKVDINDRNNNNRDKYEERRDPELNSNMSSHAVDLTCRKRKNNFCSADDVIPEKVQKTCDDDKEAGTVASAVDVDGTGKDGEHDQQQQQQQQQQAKPVKLFKPYLLDDENEEGKKSIKCEHDPIIWSHHPTCVTPSGYESQSSNAGSNFPLSSSPNDRYPFPTGSPTFQIHATTFDRIATAATPASPPQQSAGTGTSTSYWCPKGSPVSGYDSASTYSDSSDYYRSPSHPSLQTYSIDFKMQAIDSYYHDLTCRGDQLAVAGKYNVHTREVQRWLDQETNIRQGIALYV